MTNDSLKRENTRLTHRNTNLLSENDKLKVQNREYALLKKVFGKHSLDELVRQAKEIRQSKQRERQHRKDYER